MKVHNVSNSFWSVFDVLLYPALYLLFTPFLIAHLGNEGYGLFIMVNTIIVFMQILNFGIGINTLKNVASAIGKSEHVELPFILNKNISIAIVISFFCIIITTISSFCIYHFHWFNLHQTLRYTALISVILAGIIVSEKMLEQVFVNALNAFEKIALVAKYNSIVRIGNLLLTLLLITNHVNLQTVFLFTVVNYLLGLLFLYFYLLKITGYFPFKLVLNWRFLKKELNYSKWIWAQSILVILAFQLDKLLIAFWFGIEKFSYYSIVSTLFNHIHLALIAVVPWALPQIAKRNSKGMDLNQYFLSFRSLIHIVAYVGILIFTLFHHFILQLWLGEKILTHIDNYLHLFMIFELFLAFTIAPYFLLNGSGKEKISTLNTFIYSSCSLAGLAIGFLFFNSIVAIIFGMIISLVICMFIQQIMMSKILSKSLLKETVGLLIPMLTLSVFIISESQPIAIRVALILISLSCFIYVYFFQYPVNINLLRNANSNGNN